MSARRKGGLRRAGLLLRAVLAEEDAGPLALRTPGEVRELLAQTIQQVRTGRLDSKIGSTVGSLAAVLLRAVEMGELEARLAAIESAMPQLQRGAA